MKILTFTSLYPSATQPGHGIFVETRLRHLLASGGIESKVIAPVPWFPSTNARFGRYATYARVPREELRHNIEVLHPRYPVLPKIGMTLAPWMMARALMPVIERLLDRYTFDLIDAHFFYPDGVAAVMLGRHFGKPVAITARGSDLNVVPTHRLARKMIQWAARHASGLITVCQALKHTLVALGVPAERIEVLRNGVDLQLFRPCDREAERKKLGWTRTTLLSVGNLLPLKGHDIAVSALKMMPGCDLVIVGSGPQRTALERLAQDLGIRERVTFAGPITQDELRCYYGAADALVLASSREGWANVLLESMACGTPVVASAVGGTPEVVASPEAGILMAERTPLALVQSVQKLLAHYPDRDATRRYAEQFSWAPTTTGQLQLFDRILSAPRVPM